MVKWVSKAKYMVIGLVVGVLLSGTIAYAANNQFLVSLFEVKLVFNGVEKQGSDKPYQYNNGSNYVPTSLIYNGTTYVPLRFFSESIGQAVKYESKQKIIYVGQVPEDERIETFMSDMLQPFFTDGSSLVFNTNKTMTIAGNEYQKGYQLFRYSYTGDGQVTTSFNLEGKYTKISGLTGLDDSRNKNSATLEIYGDDKLLTSIPLKAGSLPQNFNLDITGVIKLDFKVLKEDFHEYSIVDLANVMIK